MSVVEVWVFSLVALLFIWAAWPPPGSKSGPVGKRRPVRAVYRWTGAEWEPAGWEGADGRKLYLPSAQPLD